MTESRAPWPMSPCSARTRWPRADRSSARRWQPILVRAKMIAQRGVSDSSSLSMASSLPRGSTSSMRCSMRSTVISSGVTLHRLGRVQLVGCQLADPGGIVAENSAVWRPHGARRRIARTSSMKPIESISSASSRTTMRAVGEDQLAAGAAGRARGRACRRRPGRRGRVGRSARGSARRRRPARPRRRPGARRTCARCRRPAARARASGTARGPARRASRGRCARGSAA